MKAFCGKGLNPHSHRPDICIPLKIIVFCVCVTGTVTLPDMSLLGSLRLERVGEFYSQFMRMHLPDGAVAAATGSVSAEVQGLK